MIQYKDLVEDVIANGRRKTDRTGVGTRSVFGRMLRFDLSKGFPAVTCKQLAWKSVVGELLWFISGSTNVDHLRRITHGPNSDKRTIWDANYEEQAINLGYSGGYLGPVYGKQWRQFGNKNPVDQLQKVIDQIKSNPDSRRLLVVAWNPEDIDAMALPPCHFAFQFEVYEGKLSLMWSQRSVDVGLGLPFNIASYALLVHIIAGICGLEVGELVFSGADVHVYENHVDDLVEIFCRSPRPLPKLAYYDVANLAELRTMTVDDYVLTEYDPHPPIKMPMAV
ncbi:td [Aeromonas phage 31]|uniref:Thymidylate synthase n=1 Tax=Aeromonas phage 31 TaxID=321023 RepID=Q56EF7_9CAUD|nr:thymidylate synthase [Aeromonas phage 31]AAX63693.1 td [Aeromonas phage 31]APU01097.1 thymidylate synthase [Aeromonas phage 31.2]